MKGDPEFVILKYQSWLETAKFETQILGSIVKEFLNPTRNYCPESPLQYHTPEIVDGSLSDFVLNNTGNASIEASASLQAIAGFSFKGNTENAVHLQGKLIRYKRLQQHDQFWAKLKKDKTVKETVPGWIKFYNTWPVCLVVGIMTCEDVEINFEGKKEIHYDGHAELPIGQITMAAGVPNPLGDTGNPQAKLDAGRKVATIFKGKSGKNQIFALELRKITTEMFSRKELVLKDSGPDVDASRLAGDDDSDDGEEIDVERPVGIDELLIKDFSPEEYDEMAG
jgi:hypothetical protein